MDRVGLRIRLGAAAAAIAVVLVWAITSALAPAAAQAPTAPNPALSLKDYVVSQSVDQNYAGAYYYRPSDYVILKGPVTIQIYIYDHGKESYQDVPIADGDTYTFSCAQYSPPGVVQQWYATVNVLQAGPSESDWIDLLQSTPSEVTSFVNQHTKPENRNAATASGKVPADLLKERLAEGVNNVDDLINASAAVDQFNTMLFLAGLKDKDTGAPLFPSLQSIGIIQVITRMIVTAAEDSKALTATQRLLGLICTGDMYKPTGGPAK